MRVVCENCGATYKIPDAKLVKEVNKATCRQCGYRMMIRRPHAIAAKAGAAEDPDEAATVVGPSPLAAAGGGLLEADTRIEQASAVEWSDEAATQVKADPITGEAEEDAVPIVPAPPVPSPDTTAPRVSPTTKPDAPQLDMMMALVGTFASAAGALLLATNTDNSATMRMVGLGIALWGALSCLFLLVTGNLWRQRGSIGLSTGLAVILAAGGTGFIEVMMHGASFDLIPDTVEAEADLVKPDPKPIAEADVAAAVDDLTADEKADATTDDEADALAEEAGDDDILADASMYSARGTQPPPDVESQRSAASAAAVAAEQRQQADQARREREATSTRQQDRRDQQDTERTRQDEERTRQDEERARRQQEDADRERQRQEEADRARQQQEDQARRPAAPAPPAPPAEPETPRMQTLPLQVVDTLIRSNLSIKKCFFSEKQRTGEMPRRVTVKFTVMPTGRISTARVVTSEFKGGPLDSCLGRSFKSIQFPPFQGEALSMTYPFVL